MAGNYPDVNSWRMAYDVDGTQAYMVKGDNSTSQYSSSQITNANSESLSASLPVSGVSESPWSYVVFIFPELRDIDGWYILGNAEGIQDNKWTNGSVFVSTDTTNGSDGSWTLLGPNGSRRETKTSMRENIVWNTALGVKAVRISYGQWASGYASSGSLWVAHLYGEPAPNENLQRLEIWHPTLDQRLGPADLDWGNVPRNSEEIRTFRVKNMHPTLTANNVRVAMSILTDTTPSVVGQQSLSQDGGSTWAAQQTLPAPLGPEAISPVLHLRRQTADNASLSLWWYRVFADALLWS